jgi:hypothetical protein
MPILVAYALSALDISNGILMQVEQITHHTMPFMVSSN